MSTLTGVLIFISGVLVGGVNAMAGGGSILTVPLLSLVGVGGLTANGTNRVAVMVQSIAASVSYWRRGIGEIGLTVLLVMPALVGGLIGSNLVAHIRDDQFEKLFGLLMLPILVLVVWKPQSSATAKNWPMKLQLLAFFFVGIYSGAIQAGSGLIILLVLSRSGYDLVTANAIKTALVASVSTVAVVVFALNGQIAWLPAAVLSAGTGLGGYFGAKLAVEGGEKLIRAVLLLAGLVLASKMIGLWELL